MTDSLKAEPRPGTRHIVLSQWIQAIQYKSLAPRKLSITKRGRHEGRRSSIGLLRLEIRRKGQKETNISEARVVPYYVVGLLVAESRRRERGDTKRSVGAAWHRWVAKMPQSEWDGSCSCGSSHEACSSDDHDKKETLEDLLRRSIAIEKERKERRMPATPTPTPRTIIRKTRTSTGEAWSVVDVVNKCIICAFSEPIRGRDVATKDAYRDAQKAKRKKV